MFPAIAAILTLSLIFIPIVKIQWKGLLLYATLLLIAGISSYFAIQALSGSSFVHIFSGSIITGPIALRLDALSAWFILVINLIFLIGVAYGLNYLKSYQNQKNNISLHYIALLLMHASILMLCIIQNGMVFLITWEIMALSAFIAVIFEHNKVSVIYAGINYLIQSHVSIIFLMLAFMWVAIKTGSFDFIDMAAYSAQNPGTITYMLFFMFFIGFAIKAGFVPFHTWLPYAHPAAPSHVSGIMSGVLIKMGIFGILRMLLILKPDYTIIGSIILAFGIISALYGVMLAIIQHNLKKLLAYHSIENIGIIGIGIGIGCIGIGKNLSILCYLGFAGALLHTLNHALFKSLLFFSAGNIYKAYHTMDIEKLGGIVKKMPHTTLLFLIAAIAICGIPPFNGFVSEFIIYSGLYSWMQNAGPVALITIIFCILGLVFTGGLALFCFAKAFGVAFLGNTRVKPMHEPAEMPALMLAPLYVIIFIILSIGLFPFFYLKILNQPVALFVPAAKFGIAEIPINFLSLMHSLAQAAWYLLLIAIIILLVRKFITKKNKSAISPTWACGFNAPAPKTQYSAASFARPYIKLFRFILLVFQREKNITDIIPSAIHYETHPYDKVERTLIDLPIKAIKSLMGRFIFLQNGRLQIYILYGIVFIALIISIPFIQKALQLIVEFFKLL